MVQQKMPPTKTNKEDPFVDILLELNLLKGSVTNLINKMKNVKKFTKIRKTGNIVSGFVKPVHVSDELAKFMDIGADDTVSRCNVNKRINEYIKENNLQNPEYKQIFKLDETLAKIFELEEGDEVNYFKMQTYLKHHYSKTAKVPVTVS